MQEQQFQRTMAVVTSTVGCREAAAGTGVEACQKPGVRSAVPVAKTAQERAHAAVAVVRRDERLMLVRLHHVQELLQALALTLKAHGECCV